MGLRMHSFIRVTWPRRPGFLNPSWHLTAAARPHEALKNSTGHWDVVNVKFCLKQLAELCDAAARPAPAAEWKRKLAELQKAQARKMRPISAPLIASSAGRPGYRSSGSTFCRSRFGVNCHLELRRRVPNSLCFQLSPNGRRDLPPRRCLDFCACLKDILARLQTMTNRYVRDIVPANWANLRRDSDQWAVRCRRRRTGRGRSFRACLKRA